MSTVFPRALTCLAIFFVLPASLLSISPDQERAQHVPLVRSDRSDNSSVVEQRAFAISAVGSLQRVDAVAPAADPTITNGDTKPQPVLNSPVVIAGATGAKGATKAVDFGAGTANDARASDARAKGNIGKAAANMLLGYMGAIIVLFYLVHNSDPDVQKMTWSAIANTLSIFCALLIFGCIKDMGALAFEVKESTGTVTVRMQIFYVFRYIFAFVIVQLCLWRYKARPLAMRAWALMGAQVVGFMGGDAFAIIQLQKPFKEDGWYTASVILIASVVIGIMMYIAQSARTWITEVDGEVEDAEHNFELEVLRAEHSFFSFAIGLLITQTARYAIAGKPVDFHGPQFNDNTSHIWKLFLVGLCFALGVFVFDIMRRALERRNQQQGTATPVTHRGLNLIKETCAMTMGWSWLYAGKWWFWYMLQEQISGGDIMTGQLCMALLVSFVSFVVMFSFDKMADRMASWGEGIRSLILGLVMLMGLAWQSVFVTAIKSRSKADYDDDWQRAIHDFQVSAFLCMLIIPAWALYMLPKFEEGEGVADGAKAEEKVN